MRGKFKINRLLNKNVYLLGILMIFIVFFSVFDSNFLSTANIINISRVVVLVAITGAAATFLLVAGYIDLSVGSTLALGATTFAWLCSRGVPIAVSVIIIICVGAVIGIFNGFGVTKLKIHAVIFTLSTFYIVKGLNLLLYGIEPISVSKPGFTFLGRGMVKGIPFQVFIILFIVGIFYFLEKKSLLYKYAVAIGGNRSAASLSGIKVNLYVIILYSLTGALAGLSGAIFTSKLAVGQQLVGYGFEFDVIVAMLVGGTSFTGGQGSVIGTLIGAIILTIVDNGFNMIGVLSFYQYIIKGIILIIAVLALSLNLRRRDKSKTLNSINS